MKLQPDRTRHLQVTDDRVYTPSVLAQTLVEHFQPSGIVCEPCEGVGEGSQAFTTAFYAQPDVTQVHAMEIERGLDFLTFDPLADSRYRRPVPFDWLITNPPWSLYSAFLRKSLQVAANVVLVVTINHNWTEARRRFAKEAGYGLSEIVELDWPPVWARMGTQLGAVCYQRAYNGPIVLTDWTGDQAPAKLREGYAKLAQEVEERRKHNAELKKQQRRGAKALRQPWKTVGD